MATSQEAYERRADSSIDVHIPCVTYLLECLRSFTIHLRVSVQLKEDALKTLACYRSTKPQNPLRWYPVFMADAFQIWWVTNIFGDAETTTGILKHVAQHATSICDPPNRKRTALVRTAARAGLDMGKLMTRG